MESGAGTRLERLEQPYEPAIAREARRAHSGGNPPGDPEYWVCGERGEGGVEESGGEAAAVNPEDMRLLSLRFQYPPFFTHPKTEGVPVLEAPPRENEGRADSYGQAREPGKPPGTVGGYGGGGQREQAAAGAGAGGGGEVRGGWCGAEGGGQRGPGQEQRELQVVE